MAGSWGGFGGGTGMRILPLHAQGRRPATWCARQRYLTLATAHAPATRAPLLQCGFGQNQKCCAADETCWGNERCCRLANKCGDDCCSAGMTCCGGSRCCRGDQVCLQGQCFPAGSQLCGGRVCGPDEQCVNGGQCCAYGAELCGGVCCGAASQCLQGRCVAQGSSICAGQICEWRGGVFGHGSLAAWQRSASSSAATPDCGRKRHTPSCVHLRLPHPASLHLCLPTRLQARPAHSAPAACAAPPATLGAAAGTDRSPPGLAPLRSRGACFCRRKLAIRARVAALSCCSP